MPLMAAPSRRPVPRPLASPENRAAQRSLRRNAERTRRRMEVDKNITGEGPGGPLTFAKTYSTKRTALRRGRP